MNKKIKIVDYTRKGKKTRYEYLNLTKWQVFKLKVKRFLKKCLMILFIGFVIYTIFELGSIYDPKTIYTKQEIIKEVPVKAPILDRIMGCESQGKATSKGTHFDKNGQVLMRSNTNRTVDIGIAQINTVWFAKATELGYDLTKEKDNRAMAQWIYENRGTEDWSASKNCWR